MKESQMGSMSIVHWMIVIGVVVLLFGRHKISDLMGDVAQGIKSFKKGIQEDEPIASRTDDTPPGSTALPAAPVSARVGEKV
jgi:sec-independent protein translocase protein TatA